MPTFQILLPTREIYDAFVDGVKDAKRDRIQEITTRSGFRASSNATYMGVQFGRNVKSVETHKTYLAYYFCVYSITRHQLNRGR